MTDEELNHRFDRLEHRYAPGHFWVLVLLLAIASKVGAC